MKDKIVIVTGGAKGIGRAIAEKLANDGYKVVIADIDVEHGFETAMNICGLFIRTDVSRESDVVECVKEAVEYGELYAVINNTGIASPKRLDVNKLSYADWKHVIDINLSGCFLFSKYAHDSLAKSNGYIINIASTRASMSEANTFAYSASKGGIVALTHSMAVSFSPDIRVNCISPGWINTDAEYLPTETDMAQHPSGRVGTPNDIAEAVSFLISGNADFINGQNLVVDGGMTIKMIYD